MSNKSYVWDAFDRSDLPSVLFGVREPFYSLQTGPNHGALRKGLVAIGFEGDDLRSSGRRWPAIVVLPPKREADVFAWLNAYADGAFPVSQFARVMSFTDWNLLSHGGRLFTEKRAREDRWACVVLGEVLSYSDNSEDLSLLPLSRASACFSAAMARTKRFHDTEEALLLCSNRLRLLEKDRRFVKRPIEVDRMSLIWALAQAQTEGDGLRAEQVPFVVVEAAQKYLSRTPAAIAPASETLDRYPELRSDSVEKRVIAYKRLAGALQQLAIGDDMERQTASILIASGAFLVGRGTSHAYLMQPHRGLAPEAPLWFGLFAAMAGPESWDSDWVRATKGIEKQLRSTFEIGEPTNADLCWSEYEWLATTFAGVNAFTALPKLYSRFISIEVLPGVTCQLRLANDESNAPEPEDRHRAAVDVVSNDLRMVIEQLSVLTDKARALLRSVPVPPSRPSKQQSLELSHNETPKRYTRPRRTKRVEE